jgi:hypothetical protein
MHFEPYDQDFFLKKKNYFKLANNWDFGSEVHCQVVQSCI